MSYGCPNQYCSFYKQKDFVIKKGSFYRKSDSRWIQRLHCKGCLKNFSYATFSPAYKQKKRRVNMPLAKLLASNVSMRRAAIILKIHRKTVKRKLEFLAKRAKDNSNRLLEKLKTNPVQHLQFDDLISIEHTKLKPLTVTVAVDVKRRLILGAKVKQIAAFGHLAALSRKKYGFRKSQHKQGLRELFSEIKDAVSKHALIESDEHQFYPEFVNKFFPNSEYKRYKGGRSCIAGQGELKKLNYDPLFAINHTCAMLRANVNRLIRKTWCTTKDPAMLEKHLQIFIDYHNTYLI